MNLNLTSLVRKLEKQLKNAEKLSLHYDARTRELRLRMAEVARAVGRNVGSFVSPEQTGKPHRKKRRMSAAGRAAVIAAQKKRWAAYRLKKGKLSK